MSTGARASCAGRAKFRKLVTTSPSDVVSCADAVDVRPIGRWERRRIEQFAVSVDCREPVPELVGDAGSQLADRRETFLQAQLLLELLNGGEIGEQAHGAVEWSLRLRRAATP